MTLQRIFTGTTATVLAVAAVLALTACGSSDSPEVANLGTADATTGGADAEEAPEDREDAILAYTQCMREEGIDLPDPEFSEPGAGARLRLGPGADPNDPDFQAAQEACSSHLEGVVGQFDPEAREGFQDAALEVAQCMRDKGFDVPDPDFSEGGGGGMLFRGGGDLDPSDPDVAAAMEECSQIFEDAGLGRPRGPAAGGED